jgi:hypothetical protein
MDSDRVERSRDFERFITFIDAIVAIAITLLVLPLVDLATELDRGPVTGLLRDRRWPFSSLCSSGSPFGAATRCCSSSDRHCCCRSGVTGAELPPRADARASTV